MVRCEHRDDRPGILVPRCQRHATFAVHDRHATLTWACDEHLASTVASIALRDDKLFIKLECFAADRHLQQAPAVQAVEDLYV